LLTIQADAGHGVFEEQAVFGLLDGAKLRPDQLHTVFFEHSGISQLHRQVQRCLPADCGQDCEFAALAFAIR
jgi:hypothetical protein